MTRFPDVAALTSTNFAFVSFSLASLSSLLRLALFGSLAHRAAARAPVSATASLTSASRHKPSAAPSRSRTPLHSGFPHTRCRNSASEAPWALA